MWLSGVRAVATIKNRKILYPGPAGKPAGPFHYATRMDGGQAEFASSIRLGAFRYRWNDDGSGAVEFRVEIKVAVAGFLHSRMQKNSVAEIPLAYPAARIYRAWFQIDPAT